jgi:hypothetical protein
MKEYESPGVIVACRLINAGIIHIITASCLIISLASVVCTWYHEEKSYDITGIHIRGGLYAPFS